MADNAFEEMHERRRRRIERLKSGNYQFGHGGLHNGNGSVNCPRRLHHHCDEFCDYPGPTELIEAGLDPKTFRAQSRR
jgi:hypothetical protein